MGQRHNKAFLCEEGVSLCSEGVGFLLSLPPAVQTSSAATLPAKLNPQTQCMRPRECHRQPSSTSLVPTKIHEAQGLSILNFLGLLKKQLTLQRSKSLRTHTQPHFATSYTSLALLGLWT